MGKALVKKVASKKHFNTLTVTTVTEITTITVIEPVIIKIISYQTSRLSRAHAIIKEAAHDFKKAKAQKNVKKAAKIFKKLKAAKKNVKDARKKIAVSKAQSKVMLPPRDL